VLFFIFFPRISFEHATYGFSGLDPQSPILGHNRCQIKFGMTVFRDALNFVQSKQV